MIQDIVAMPLPVEETFRIRKNSISNGTGKRICLVTGTHGDELEGQYVCFLMARKLKNEIEKLRGTVDIYPATNPLGIESISRSIPAFDIDMNRTFPGDAERGMMEYTAAKIVEDLTGADLVIDIHASNIYLTEMPQIRINELHRDELLPLAEQANVDFIWVHSASTVLEATLAYSLNSRGTPCLVVEMGVGMRLTGEYGEQMTDGIFNLMRRFGMWEGETAPVRKPIISEDPDEVEFLNAPTPGMFMKVQQQGAWVKKGETVGFIFDPLTGDVKETITAARSGLLFTVRDYPLVDEGSLMGRILVRERDA